MDRVWRIVHWTAEGLKIAGAFCLVGMMALTCLDVLFRRFLERPILGAVELVSFMATLIPAFALAYTHKEKGHIGVELLMRYASPRTQRLVDICTTMLSLGLFGLLTWQMFEYARVIQQSGEVSTTLEFPEYLIIYAVTFGVFVLVWVLVEELLAHFQRLRNR